MKLICAWCRKEGKPDLMGEKEPLEDQRETHGLCPEHRLQVEEELAAYRRAAERQRVEAERLRDATSALREKVDP